MLDLTLKFLLFILLCSPSPLLFAHCLPKSAHVPGGVAVIKLDLASPEPPVVYYQQYRTLVLRDPENKNQWLSIVGIPLDAKPGTHQITVSSTQGTSNKLFVVKNKTYPQEHLTLANTRKVLPLAEDLPLIEEQYLKTIATYEHWEDKDLNSVVLKLPVKGRKSSPFGLQRTMNKIAQNPHSGLDIAAPKGTPIKNPKAGKVINIGNYFYSGKIVFIDHGQGFITSYCHLDQVNVQVGQEVKLGEVLGTIGNTGRATGPHLHWSVSLNGVRVDPQWFIYE